MTKVTLEKSPKSRLLQSNAPALEELLMQPGSNMYARTAFSHSKAVEFATPKAKMKSRPRIEITDDIRQQKTAKQKHNLESVDFATPRASHNKPKIVHKEKLSAPIRVKRDILGKTTSSSSVPTAHVHPSPISTSNYGGGGGTSPGLSSHPCWDDSALTTTLTGSPYTGGSPKLGDTINSFCGDTKRYSDVGFKEEEFRELIHDPDSTFLDTTTNNFRNGFANKADKFSLHERDMTLQSKLSDEFTDMTRSVSALSLDAPTVTNLSDPGMSMYGSTGNIYQNTGPTPSHNIYNRPGYMPSYNSFDRLPTSFQAASFSTNNMGSFHDNVGPYHHHHQNLGDTHFSSDLSQWQQKHQEQLHRQHFDPHPSAMNGHPNSSYNPQPMSGDPHRMDAIKRAADNIIKEKDNIIDRQKIKILELERNSKQSEVELHKSFLKKFQEDGNARNLKLQEAQYESATLKAQLAEVMSKRNGDLEQMENKLAATEYELSELKASLDKEIVAKSRDIKEMEAKAGDKDSIITDYKEKLSDMKKVNEELYSKVSSMERYMSDLPTVDENLRKHSEINLLKEEKHKYKHRAHELEKKVKELHKGLSSRDGLIESLEETEKKLREEVSTMQSERDNLSFQVQELRSDGASIPEEDLAELTQENHKLRAECDRAKKVMLLDSRHKKLQHMDAQHKQEIAQLEERLYQDENSVTALRDDMANKEQHLKKLRSSVKELGSQNQDLMEQNMMLQDKLKDFEKQHTGEAEKLEKRLIKEMAVCFSELQSLVQICVQHAEGQDPNISVLLGVKANTMCDIDLAEPLGDGIQSLKFKVSKVKELREEIDKLRELLSNKYAEDMGENLNCTTQ